MRTIIKSLLASSIVLGTLGVVAEPLPNFNNQPLTWNFGQTPIAWGDCVPVPVVPVPQNNINMGSMPFPQPMMIPFPNPRVEQPIILPPPSPFFNTAPNNIPLPLAPSPMANAPQVVCDNTELQSLQLRYNQGASASKAKIQELSQALDDANNQMADARIIIESFSKNQETNTIQNTDLNKQLSHLDNNNKTLQTRLSTAEMTAGAQARKITALNQSALELTALQSAYRTRNDENAMLKRKFLELDGAHKSLKAQLGTAEANAGSQARKLTALNQSASELTAIQSAYKAKNDENASLKMELAGLSKEKLSLSTKVNSLHTSSTLKGAQDKDIIEGLRKKLSELDNAYKSLRTKLGTAEANAGSQARKLTALGQSATELTAIQSAYKAKNAENAELKQKLASLDGTYKSLQTKLGALETNSGSQARKITALGQSAVELVAIQSAYKAKNAENAELKQKLASLDNTYKSLQTKLGTLETNSGSQARKITALGQSATELVALQSAYKARNNENVSLKAELASRNEAANICKFEVADLKKKLAESGNNRKSLLAKITTLETTSSNQARKITALMATTKELDGLKSAYKDLSSKKAELNSKLTAATADSDKDGVLDSSDKCPYSLDGAEVNASGCLADADNDGIVDSKDNCPVSPIGSHVNEQGCPRIVDADSDGVADANDLCPTTTAGTTVNQFGCEPTENITLKGVNFATGSARLTTNSFPVLAAAAATLKKHPDLKIEISGYTDNQGGSNINRNLSQRRANTVMIQLIKDGVDANMLVAKGYGESNPIASNNTADGRATNRRVELKIRK